MRRRGGTGPRRHLKKKSDPFADTRANVGFWFSFFFLFCSFGPASKTNNKKKNLSCPLAASSRVDRRSEPAQNDLPKNVGSKYSLRRKIGWSKYSFRQKNVGSKYSFRQKNVGSKYSLRQKNVGSKYSLRLKIGWSKYSVSHKWKAETCSEKKKQAARVTLPQTTRPRTTLAQGDASHHACATSTTRHSVSRVLPRLRRSYRLTKPRPKITRERERERRRNVSCSK